ncbi:hypothetical protein ACFVAF_17915 [Streptomyces sp. NPDC057596]|uniref:5'-methylthioadenosine/S-adenosylhomocysteine nucleosidase family protein n=1 Tax=Streptomyces sp. NPDC057596 TaxID=3346178 RepID=UPI0036853B48
MAVLTAVQEESEAFRRVGGLTQRLKGRPYYIAPESDPAFPEVIHREIDRNNIQSGERVRDVIEHWQPELLILCGIAGGINGHAKVSVGDVIIPPYIHYCSFAKLGNSGMRRRYIPFDYPSINLHQDYVAPLRDDRSWITDSLRDSLPDGWEPTVHVESLVAGDKIYGDPNSQEQQRIVGEYDEAVAVDMESVGLCRGVAASRNNPQYNPRLLIIRSVSDIIDDPQNNETREEWRPHACEIASTFTWRVVTDIVDMEPDLRRTPEAVA